jgi:hypothetical protein
LGVVTVSGDVRVSSWSELNELVFERSWNPDLRRFRPTLAFRGVADASAMLKTDLATLAGPRAADIENHLLRNFRKYARAATAVDDTLWAWLTVGRHHGLPTRLLDWSFSPQVAMHFATASLRCADRDAAIWCVDYIQAHRLLPPPLRDALEAEGSDLFTVEMLQSIAPDLRAFDALSRAANRHHGSGPPLESAFLLFFEPPSFDQRIVNQAALFSVMSSPTASIQDWLRAQHGLAFRIIIPAELKLEVRDKLDQANVNERLLFPGLDGLTRWLRRYYTPRR